MSWAEAKWTVDSLLQKIGQAPNNMRSFIAYSLSATSIGLKFQEPADSYDANNNLICSVGGVMIRMSDTGYPTKPSEGTLVVNNTNLGAYVNTPFTVSGLTKGKKYYFSAFPYSVQGVYNLSSNAANRADATPAAGEIANVTISIDDDSAFSSVVVTCVDETESASTQSATLTKTKKTASFVVPIGHTYHIEYGAEDGYSKPDNTTPKVSVAGTTSNYTATYYYFTATIAVTYPAGATCTCECGSTKYTAPNTSGSHTFQVHNVGTWTVKAVSGSDTDSKSVSITSSGQSRSVELSFVKIYGISRDITATSPAWARTDSAVGKTATATVGTTAGSSDFNNCYPWSGIVRETLSTGDVMVKIPKFWYRRYRSGNVEYLKIADKATSGFTLHPAFNHGGVAKDYLYVGAYKTTSGNKSASGVSPLVNQTRATMRSNAKAKGTGWGIIDIAALSAIQMLILVEFANNNAATATVTALLSAQVLVTMSVVSRADLPEQTARLMWFGAVSRVCGVMCGNGSMVSTGTTALTMCATTRPSTQTIPLRTTPPSPLREQPTGLPVISRRRVLTLAVILMSCSRLPQVAEVKRPMIVTLVGLLQVGASSYAAVIGAVARDVVSLRLI